MSTSRLRSTSDVARSTTDSTSSSRAPMLDESLLQGRLNLIIPCANARRVLAARAIQPHHSVRQCWTSPCCKGDSTSSFRAPMLDESLLQGRFNLIIPCANAGRVPAARAIQPHHPVCQWWSSPCCKGDSTSSSRVPSSPC